VRKALVAALAVVVVAGAAVAAVPVVERRAAAHIKADIERGGGKVGSVEVGLFDRKIALDDFQMKRSGEVTIGHWEASGLAWPLEELIRGRTPFAGLGPGDPFTAGHVKLSDLKLTQDRGNWSIASVAIDDLRLDRYDAIVGLGQYGHLAARVGGALSMGHLEQKGTVFTDAATSDRITIDSLTVDRFDRGVVGAMTAAGVEFTARPPRDPVFRLGELKLGDLDFHRWLKAIGNVSWRPGMPLGRVDLGSASLSGFSGEALTRYGVSLGRITQRSRREGTEVRHSEMRIEGFVLDPPARDRQSLQVRLVLQAMGLKQLKLDADCSGTEDRAKGEITVDRCAVAGPDLGEVNLSLKVVGADAPLWVAIDEGNSFAMLGTKAGFGNARLVVTDRGLVERTVKAMATLRGQPPAALRAGMVQDIRRFQPPGILITEDLSKLLDTVAKFVERGGTLTVDAKPPSPIGLDKAPYFARPGPDLVEVLGLSATLSPEK
jgi:hypothetical protein